ncbi:acetate/propionate family kinase [Stratiformator vulcanicus]|uniref:Acetate kinase n=1 Tax=Stratiformator vulcanicus TaxID=2527980 RepID=A0A517QY59_9PLAN|nr:acetate/propionate family kinase [Stratiformator vulcanicus]QDT36490.1 Acetate kinase [Stratiformator vulcanicus]
MKVLVANLGSTSFKYRLFDLPEGRQLARGGIDRIGQESSHCFVEIGDQEHEVDQAIADHAAAVQLCLDQLTDDNYGCLKSVDEVSAIGFKAVHAAHLSGVRIVDDELLSVMQELFDIAPAHNPPYVKAMRQLREAFPQIPLVAALETAFHETIPPENRSYAIPRNWEREHGIKKWGFHGASHRYIAGRVAELTGRDDLKVVSCHLGGSSSLCAIDAGQSKAASMGMTPQTGLPQNNRVGDFDPFALPYLIRRTGKSLEDILKDLSSKGGLYGLSNGLSTDLRDLEEAAAKGHESAGLAIKTYVAEIRRYLGGYFALLGGCDAVVFTGGIGENSKLVRAGVCNQMDWAGLKIDKQKNRTATGEAVISSDDSTVQVWTIPTNEEIIVARQTADAVSRVSSVESPGQ